VQDGLADRSEANGLSRADVSFPSGDVECAGWLYSPADAGPGARAAVVLGHGLGAVREMRLDAYAERFAAAGYVCLAFDYRHFGGSGGEPRQLLDVGRQLEDWVAAVGFVRGVDGVDPERVAVFGSSFGGGHAILTAARDERIAAAIAQCPFTDGFASALTPGPVSTAKVGRFALRDELSRLRGREPVRVALAGPPRSAALMPTVDADAEFPALVPPGSTFVNAVAARVALRIPWYRPGRAAARVRAPILFCVCERDSVAPARATLRHAGRAPRGEVVRYPIGHFEIYRGEAFERAVADQLEFLRRNLPARKPAD
jgi:pimeloyl-ACP methyl ester carboxylesterase